MEMQGRGEMLAESFFMEESVPAIPGPRGQ
jgi:hypothetical protein